jgi:hypothetical protein
MPIKRVTAPKLPAKRPNGDAGIGGGIEPHPRGINGMVKRAGDKLAASDRGDSKSDSE